MSCAFCAKPLGCDWVGRQVCAACGSPQSVAGTETYFSVLSVAARFHPDLSVLEKNFYRLSRALHPDRFTSASADVQAASLERMSLLNDAYRVLKHPAELREYFLQLQRLPATAKVQIPMELAENWFELQEAVLEEPQKAAGLLCQFEEILRQKGEAASVELRGIELEINRALDQEKQTSELFGKLARSIQNQAYLTSLQRDTLAFKKRLG